MSVDNCIFIRSAFRNPLNKSEYTSDKYAVIQTRTEYMQIIFGRMLSETVARGCSVKKVFLQNFAKFTGKPYCQGLFFNKTTLSKRRLWQRRFL